MKSFVPTRRTFLKTGTAAAALIGFGPAVLRQAAAQDADLAPYKSAKIDWQQTSGETITVAVIPASYFENLITLAPQFKALTGIDVRFEKIPPAQIRQKSVIDLTSKTGTYATHAADPMYYSLYAANKWVEPLDSYLADKSLTDADWFKFDDIIPAWRAADSVDGKLYGVPYDGEVTIQVYRKDLYDAKGLKPADDLETFVEERRGAEFAERPHLGHRAARRRRRRPEHVHLSLDLPRIRRRMVQGRQAHRQRPRGREGAGLVCRSDAQLRADGGVQLELARYRRRLLARHRRLLHRAHSSASVINNPEKSKIIGKVGYARWPKGPSGKRVSSIWNWGFPINAAQSEKKKKATWLFIQWAASAETQARTAHRFAGPAKRSGVNRSSIWKDPDYVKLMNGFGDNFVEATMATLQGDTDVDWRPRVPQWPAIGDTMATAIQSALSGQATVKAALDDAQRRVEPMMRG